MLFQTIVFCYFFIATESFRVPLDPKIIGGTEVPDRSLLPYQAALYFQGTVLFCGASIIHENYVLTAAQCTVSEETVLSPSDIKVVTGNLLSDDLTIMKDVERIYYHSLYDPSTPTNGYDIALIQISGSFAPWTSNVYPIGISRDNTTSGSCVVSGWGRTDPEANLTSSTLTYAEVNVTDYATCDADYLAAVNKSIPLSVICAGAQGNGACQGDAGGPLACSRQLAGIVSYDNGCSQTNVPGVYTEVAAYVEWIGDIILPKIAAKY